MVAFVSKLLGASVRLVRLALGSRAAACVLGMLVPLVGMLVLWWFFFDSGLTAPAGFVYSQF